MRRLLLVLALALAAAGCGGTPESEGRAMLWVTRDRGADVILTASVPAGTTVMRALRSEADVETGYGGRFVRAIEGVRSDSAAGRDWFYFVNGIEADRGAAEYRIRPGDVVWWDYRTWSGDAMRQPVVVGAFPEPFLHGYDGVVRPAAVRYDGPKTRGAAFGLANAVRARSVERADVAVAASANAIFVYRDEVPFRARLRRAGAEAGSPIVIRISLADAKQLLRHPDAARYRYQGLR